MSMPRRSGDPAATADDEFVLVLVSAAAAAALVGSAGLLWLAGVDWLLEHGVLVAAAASPMLPMPGCAGAGLDGSRLAVAAGLLLAASAWVSSAIWRRFMARQGLE